MVLALPRERRISWPRKASYPQLLLVGADPWTTNQLRSLLLRRKYMVSVSHNVGAARAMLAHSSYDVLLIDVSLSLPDLDGLALCRQLRADGVSLPVLLVHERGTVADLVNGFDAGADAYVLGPYMPNTLFAELGDLLRREDPLFH